MVCNLMWTFILLNLHQLTESKVQLNIKQVNYHYLNDIARSYQQDTGLTGEVMEERLTGQRRLWRID